MPGLAGGLGPVGGVQARDARRASLGAGGFRDAIDLLDRHVELVGLGVFDLQELATIATDFERDQTPIATDAMIGMDDGCADFEFREIAQDLLGIPRRTLATPGLLRAFAEQFSFGEYGQLRMVKREALVTTVRKDGEPHDPEDPNAGAMV